MRRNALGFMFCLVLIASKDDVFWRRCYAGLLNHMSKFVRQQASSVGRTRSKLGGAENDIPTHRIGKRIDCPGRFCRAAIRVHPYVTEILAEARLHAGASGGVERLSAGAEHLTDGQQCPARVAGKVTIDGRIGDGLKVIAPRLQQPRRALTSDRARPVEDRYRRFCRRRLPGRLMFLCQSEHSEIPAGATPEQYRPTRAHFKAGWRPC